MSDSHIPEAPDQPHTEREAALMSELAAEKADHADTHQKWNAALNKGFELIGRIEGLLGEVERLREEQKLTQGAWRIEGSGSDALQERHDRVVRLNNEYEQKAEAEIARLRQDEARLNWLEQHSYRYAPDVPPKVYVIAHSSVWPAAVPNQLRAAIDAACAK